MARPVFIRPVTIGVDEQQETIGLCLNMHALDLLQDKFGAEFDMGKILSGRSLREVGELVRIFMEGWRLRMDPARPEFTIKDAYDVIDNAGGLAEFAPIVEELARGSVSPEALRRAEEQAKRAMEGGGAEGPAPDPTARAVKTATPSRPRPSRPASAGTSSGG